MTKTDSRRYYPTALALYITYFVLGIAATIMGQYKQDFAALWGASKLADGSFDVSSVVAVIAAIGLGRLVAFPIAGPLSDRLGRRLSALIGCVLYAIFLLAITFAPNMYIGYVLAVISGMANSFLDTSITPSCMEIFKEKGTIANIFTKLSISIAQFLLPFAISFVAVENLPFNTIFLATAVIIVVDGIFLAFLPFSLEICPFTGCSDCHIRIISKRVSCTVGILHTIQASLYKILCSHIHSFLIGAGSGVRVYLGIVNHFTVLVICHSKDSNFRLFHIIHGCFD